MAAYKVPQDVEAEDKLLGPFSFRQFVYLIIAFMAGAIAFFLFQILPPLAIIPLPVVLLFGILALPLRKDQPMETYLLALLRFYLKPKQRLWNPDGTITYVKVIAPKLVEPHLTKDIAGTTAKERLDYLARVMDTRGWSTKGVLTQPAPSVTADVAVEAQTAPDVLDENAELSRSFENLIAKNKQEQRDQAVQDMQQAAKQPAKPPQQPAAAKAGDEGLALHYNPYPNAIHQKVVHPLGEPVATAPKKKPTKEKPKTTSAMKPPLSPDIMRLASNDDLSISAIAHEAHRLQDKDEVVIQLH